MGAVPKRRLSTGRQGRREAGKKLQVSASQLTRTTKRQRKELKKQDKPVSQISELQDAA